MNKVWYELVNVKYGEVYLSKYLNFQRTMKKTFQILTLVVSISGILSWKYFENYVWIAFALIAVLQLLLLIENQIIRSDKEIEEIARFRMLYTKYFNKLEKLWTKYQYKRISEEKGLDKYFKFRQTDWEQIEKVDTKLNIKRYMWLMRKTEFETNNYLNKYHIND